MFHSTAYTNKKIRRLLATAGIAPENFSLAIVIGRPARTKNQIIITGNKVTLFCDDCVVKGFIKKM